MANQSEIGAELHRLMNTLPAPRGIKFEKAFPGYVTALAPFTVAEISEAISRYLAAEWPDISLKFYPRAPELAHIVRLVRSEHSKVLEKVARAEQAEKDRLEQKESEKLRVKTPEQKARAKALYDDFIMSTYGDRERQARAKVEKDRAAIRAKYGISEIALDALPDRPLPKGMKQIADASPGIPEPTPRNEKPDDFGGLT